jgi:hypothetical protein
MEIRTRGEKNLTTNFVLHEARTKTKKTKRKEVQELCSRIKAKPVQFGACCHGDDKQAAVWLVFQGKHCGCLRCSYRKQTMIKETALNLRIFLAGVEQVDERHSLSEELFTVRTADAS